MAHEQGSSQNNEDATLDAADGADLSRDADEPRGAQEPEVARESRGVDAGVPGTLVDLPVEVDAETAELLRTLEMPSVPLGARDDGIHTAVPLSGVLRRTRRPRSRVAMPGGLDEATVQDTDATMPDVIAYEPIRVEAPWASEAHATFDAAPGRAVRVEAPPTLPEVEIGSDLLRDTDQFQSVAPLASIEPDDDDDDDDDDAPSLAPHGDDSGTFAPVSIDVDALDEDDEPHLEAPEAEDTSLFEASPPPDDDAAVEQLPSLELDIAPETDELDSDDLDATDTPAHTDDAGDLDAEELDELEVEELDTTEPVDVKRPAALLPPQASIPPAAAAPAAALPPPETARRQPPPPLPPKPPPPPARRVKEGELVLTQDALDEILAGGRADDGRDLPDEITPEAEWYREIFTEDFFRTLPRNFHKQTVREAEFVIDRLGVEPGARLLDLCCGFGRHTMELARRHFEVVGLDLAMPLLQKALNEAQRRNLSIKFVHGDMRQLNFQGVFDGILNVQTSFGFFTDRTNFKVLQGIWRALKPGGRFFVETINRDFVCEEIPMRIWWEGTECLILEEVDFEYSTSVLKVKRSFVYEDASREPWEHHIHIRLYSAHELQYLLRRAGFEIIELSGDYNYPGRFFGNASRRVVLVAERPVD